MPQCTKHCVACTNKLAFPPVAFVAYIVCCTLIICNIVIIVGITAGR
jgi:hypothetical protein